MTEAPPPKDPGLDASALAKWKDQLATFRSSSARVEALETLRADMQVARSGAAELLQNFLAGQLSFKEFSSTFDKQTRSVWTSLGAKGPGGAMLFNQLAKYTTKEAELEAAMRNVLTAPPTDDEARAALDAFAGYLSASRQEPGGGSVPSTSRFPFLLSVIWSLQADRLWPVAYPNSERALAPTGTKPTAEKVLSARYLAFATRWRALRVALAVDDLTLSELIAWLASTTEPEPNETEAAPSRTWLIALGRGSELWPQCHKHGVIGINWKQPGELTSYESADALRAAHGVANGGELGSNDLLACWQFAHEMQVGDVVYVKRGRRKIIAEGRVTSGYTFVGDASDPPLVHQRSVKWIRHGDWEVREKSFVLKTLTEITTYAGMLRDIRRALEGAAVTDPDGDDDDHAGGGTPYTLDKAEGELFLPRKDIERLLALLKHKKNLILQGPPGVGKTFVARRLAALLTESDSAEQIRGVQFHPSYSYEDFVQGLRPLESGGFARQDGPLLRFCKDALEDADVPYVLVIDEINRGNVSKILGELLSLLEADKRHPRYAVTLAYAREEEPPFHLPPNLYVIGTMNTADRSLALVDYALRRRFAFFELPAAFGTARFEEELTKRGVEPKLRHRIAADMRALNARIVDDPELGRGFVVGHSYFCGPESGADEAWYRRILDFEILPLLEEYWHDAPDTLRAVRDGLVGG